MLPIIMLAAQLYSKHKQQEEAKRQELAKLRAERVRQLGGNTMGIEAANFNRQQSEQNYASPQELMSIYGSASGGGKNTAAQSQALDAGLEPNKTAYTLERPGDTQLEWPGRLKDNGDYSLPTGSGSPYSFTDNDTTDPYYLRRMKLR